MDLYEVEIYHCQNQPTDLSNTVNFDNHPWEWFLTSTLIVPN